MGEFRMPSLGADMDRGTLLEWKVAPGDEVHRGDIVAVVDTDKSDIDVEIFEDATIVELVVAEGEEVPVGTVLATLAPPGGSSDTPAPPDPPEESAPAPEPEPAPGRAPRAETAAPSRSSAPLVSAPARIASEHAVVHSPLVRHLADRLGVDLDQLAGTGPGGRITRHDVERAAQPRPGAKRSADTDRVLASPLARTRARAAGLDLTDVRGTGPGGAIQVADVDDALAAQAVQPTPQRTDAKPAPRSAVPAPVTPSRDEPATTHEPATTDESAAASTDRRRDRASAQRAATTDEPAAAPTDRRRDRASAQRAATARLMARAKRDIPHYYLRTTVDLSTAMAWLEEHNRDRSISERMLPGALLLKASALATAEVPELNGHWIDGELHHHDAVDLGVAVSLRGGGLVAPAIAGAEALTLDELMAELRELVARARAGRLSASQLIDPSITVTNLGDQGVEEVTPVIYPPQVAIVGFGRVAERPWAVDGMLAVHPLVVATLAADHRATSGHEGARYLSALDRLLQRPEDL